MAKESAIEWTESTWNPWHGCHKISAGCKNCYMFRDKAKYGQDPNVVVRSKTKFYDPLKWKEPQTIFTCSWSDFFIEEADPWRDEAFAIMALTPQHTYQVLTKRPDRMLEYMSDRSLPGRIALAMGKIASGNRPLMELGDEITRNYPFFTINSPLDNVWLGVSVEDQKTADERIPLLLQTPAAVRWLSIEPLLGPVNLCDRPSYRFRGAEQINYLTGELKDIFSVPVGHANKLEWIVAGGESGPDARPMHPDWPRSIRDQCQASGVPFFFKQWGEFLPFDAWKDQNLKRAKSEIVCIQGNGIVHRNQSWEDARSVAGYTEALIKVGKKKAGRTLDARTWDEMPEVSNGR